MRVTLKNIGSIKNANIDLDKELIIFIGPNNTGKTYASYCLYGIDMCPYNFSEDYIESIIDIDFTPLFNKGTFEINLETLFTKDKIDSILENTEKQYKDFLPKLFATDKSFFENSKIGFSYGNIDSIKEYFNDSVMHLGGVGSENVFVNIEKQGNILKLKLTKLSLKGKETPATTKTFGRLSSYLKEGILEHSFYHINGDNAFFLPAERIGISIFSKDLLRSRFEKTNTILRGAESLRGSESNAVLRLMNSELNTYSLPIQNALTQYEENTIASNRKSPPRQPNKELAQLADELEKKVLKGKISVNEAGDVYYNASLKIHIAGSMVKSLTSLVFYLRYNAFPGDLLIIDEPEINLHPDNQRIVARILAKVSKLGIKVVVSTHSDYFIREINNLIMLNKKHAETFKLKKKYNYSNSEILDYKKVGAYLFKKDKVDELIVKETGMEAATIDEEINKLNNSANDIYWTLFED